MKKISLFVIAILVSLSIYSSSTATATLRLPLNEEKVLIGFSKESEVFNGVSEFDLGKSITVDSITVTDLSLCYFWKVITGNNYYISLSATPFKLNGTGTGVDETIHYTITGAKNSTYWDGTDLEFNTIDTSSSTLTGLKAYLKNTTHSGMYTKGVCNMTVKINSGQNLFDKKYGVYTATLTLTIQTT